MRILFMGLPSMSAGRARPTIGRTVTDEIEFCALLSERTGGNLVHPPFIGGLRP
jgi:hypothetical protein